MEQQYQLYNGTHSVDSQSSQVQGIQQQVLIKKGTDFLLIENSCVQSLLPKNLQAFKLCQRIFPVPLVAYSQLRHARGYQQNRA